MINNKVAPVGPVAGKSSCRSIFCAKLLWLLCEAVTVGISHDLMLVVVLLGLA